MFMGMSEVKHSPTLYWNSYTWSIMRKRMRNNMEKASGLPKLHTAATKLLLDI